MDRNMVVVRKKRSNDGDFPRNDRRVAGERQPQSGGQQHKNGRQVDKLSEFYFANTYPDDKDKAQNMKRNVEFDLKPFMAYLNASINQIGKSTTEGAEVKIVADNSQESVLEPQFTLIKVKSTGSVFEVDKPKDICMITVDDDKDFDTESFEIFQRKATICTHDNRVDTYNGTVFVRLEGDGADSNIKYDLYDNDKYKDESIKCRIVPVDFNAFASYRFEGIDGDCIERVAEEGEKLVVQANKVMDDLESICLFGENLPVTKKDAPKKLELTAGNRSIREYGDYYAVAPAMDKTKIDVFSGKNKVPYERINLGEWNEKDVQELLKTQEVSVRNGRLVYDGDEQKTVQFSGLDFKIKSEKNVFKKRLKDKKGKPVGTIIEVVADVKSIRDLESNVDVFFKESTESLTDRLPFQRGKNREFVVGWKDESQSLLEIAEKIQGDLKKIDDLPERLFAVPNDWQLKRQKEAIFKLQEKPCRQQRMLLELFERKSEGGQKGAAWKAFHPKEVQRWYILTDESYDGCAEQREFVGKALATGDFGFLDGPPGSGKTTVLLELIAQLVMQGKRVLLTASTNAAVDNILERLDKLPPKVQDKILAVRLGNENVISETVEQYTISKIDAEDAREEIVRRANLVCGTIFGVLKHPEFNLNDKNQPVRPLYDYLIVDEASKTTFQDFLIPALYSEHWILSGDLKQLTPYVEQDTIQSSLEEIPEFDRNWQRVQTILQLAKDNRIAEKPLGFYMVVPPEQIKATETLVTKDWAGYRIGIVAQGKSDSPYCVSLDEIRKAEPKAVIFYGAKLLLIEDTVFREVEHFLPPHYTPMFDVESDEKYTSLFLAASTKHYISEKKISLELGSHKNKTTYKEWKAIAQYWTKALKEESWAQQITWRLCRLQELAFDEADKKTVEGYKKQIEERLPSDPEKKEKVREYCDALSGIALPSVLQLLQQGLAEEVIKNKKRTTLNAGFEEEDFERRHTMLTYQHRMHTDISRFSAEKIYHGKALRDGSEMKEVREWTCPVFGSHRNRWIDTTQERRGQDDRNENRHEVSAIVEKIKEFMEWTRDNPKSGGNWSVACLTYYKRQERNLKQEIRKLFGEQREKSWYRDEARHIEVFIYTVDKFQGREADVVFLSMVKSGKASLGFMDSPNRLNVALTRARFQRVIVGSRRYFEKTKKSKLLKDLAQEEERK